MKKGFKVAGVILLFLVIAGSCIAAYIKFALPDVGKSPDLKVERTPERLKKGKYLVDAVMACTDCHSPRDWLGAKDGAKHYSGGEAEGWQAYPINAQAVSPIPWDNQAMAFYAEKPKTGDTDPYKAAGFNGDWATLPHIPRDKLRVLAVSATPRP